MQGIALHIYFQFYTPATNFASPHCPSTSGASLSTSSTAFCWRTSTTFPVSVREAQRARRLLYLSVRQWRTRRSPQHDLNHAIRARRPLITTRCRPLSIAEARAEVSEERKEDWAIHSVQGWSPSRYRFLGKGWSHAMRSKRKWHLIGEASVSVRAWKSMLAQINIAKLSYPQSRRTESILQTLPLESNLRLHSLLEGNRTPADIGGSVG